MAILMVREPSEQPNITNIDDIIPFRYAYGDQNGYVIGKGTELAYTINGSDFEIGSGRVVLQGVESDIDANGVTITIDNVATLRYYVIYYLVNLGTNSVSIGTIYDTAGYPTIDTGDDLIENTSGIARLALYKFTAINGSITNVTKLVEPLEFTGRALNGYDLSKGTIEQRFTNLGFRQGSVQLAASWNTTTNFVKRQGNYVFGQVEFSETISGLTSNQYNKIGTLPENFRPKAQVNIGIQCSAGYSYGTNPTSYDTSDSFTGDVKGYINTSGEIYVYVSAKTVINLVIAHAFSTAIKAVYFGFESNPIE